MNMSCHTELLNDSPLLLEETFLHSYSQHVLGSMGWAIALGRHDIQHNTSATMDLFLIVLTAESQTSNVIKKNNTPLPFGQNQNNNSVQHVQLQKTNRHLQDEGLDLSKKQFPLHKQWRKEMAQARTTRKCDIAEISGNVVVKSNYRDFP
jgi:hypothetical protein